MGEAFRVLNLPILKACKELPKVAEQSPGEEEEDVDENGSEEKEDKNEDEEQAYNDQVGSEVDQEKEKEEETAEDGINRKRDQTYGVSAGESNQQCAENEDCVCDWSFRLLSLMDLEILAAAWLHC